jgi:hypothetical protein
MNAKITRTFDAKWELMWILIQDMKWYVYHILMFIFSLIYSISQSYILIYGTLLSQPYIIKCFIESRLILTHINSTSYKYALLLPWLVIPQNIIATHNIKVSYKLRQK